MVLESECMETDPVAMMERCEREKKEVQLERHQCIERRFAKEEERFAKLEQQHASSHEGPDAAHICQEGSFLHRCEAIQVQGCKSQTVCMSKDETEPRDVAVQSDSSNGHVESDDALEAVDEEQRGWSAARRMAYSKISQSPDSYYYYYTAPGEMHKHGLWSSHEHAVFMSHFDQPGAWAKARGKDMRWGVFSTMIPGRVGYQCCNYYRYLTRKQRGQHHYQHQQQQGAGSKVATSQIKQQEKKTEEMEHTGALCAPSLRHLSALKEKEMEHKGVLIVTSAHAAPREIMPAMPTSMTRNCYVGGVRLVTAGASGGGEGVAAARLKRNRGELDGPGDSNGGGGGELVGAQSRQRSGSS